ncbi:MAG: radical SAM protein [Methanomicrobiales archaeon]|nr:radical SAM protein [Methanomicrobiales archaeon]
MLLKRTRSICPVCTRALDASMVEEGGKVWLERTCPDHGFFRHLYWSDAAMFRRFEGYHIDGRGIENPVTRRTEAGCPFDCGLCNEHLSGTLLGNIDLTNRCNLFCDFCFVNAKACGYVYEPSFEEIVAMMSLLRAQKPVPAPAVQFAGGEPTMRDDLMEIIRKAKEMGFQQVQMATNGIMLAKDPGYVKELKEAGLSTVYLHFDGISKETDPYVRQHMKAVDHCNGEKLGVVLVPTIINGRNDHEVGDIIRYAAKNISVVRGVNFQPVAFTGAASDEDVTKRRVTIPDLTRWIEEQTDGRIRQSDFYPVPSVVCISNLVEEYTGRPQVRFTTHQHCGAATYAFVNGDEFVPINRIVNVDKFFESVEKMAEELRRGGSINKYLALSHGVKELYSSVKESERGDTAQFWKLLAKTLILQDFNTLRDFHWNALFIGTMHFMDCYNYDIERVKRCCIHYATPDMRIIPFCSYNSGPVHREKIWRRYARKFPRDEISEGKR